MFRALLAHLQETLHERRFGDYCVLGIDNKLVSRGYVLCRRYIYNILLDYIRLNMSESENAVGTYCMLYIHTVRHNTYPLDISLLSIPAYSSHQTCVRVVSPEDGQVMPETCRDFET
jgi:hypothetical protein